MFDLKEKEFWKIYDNKYEMYESANFSLKTERLGGDKGCFEVAIFRDNGAWCIETTVERSNEPSRTYYDSEDEAFDTLMSLVRLYMRTED